MISPEKQEMVKRGLPKGAEECFLSVQHRILKIHFFRMLFKSQLKTKIRVNPQASAIISLLRCHLYLYCISIPSGTSGSFQKLCKYTEMLMCRLWISEIWLAEQDLFKYHGKKIS